MAKSPDAKLPKHFFGEMNETNRHWFDLYCQQDIGEDYKTNIKEFLAFKEYTDKPFNTFEIDDIQKYLQFLDDHGYSQSTRKDFVGQISGFKKFLSKKCPNDFNRLFLYELQDLKSSISAKRSKTNGEILDLIQISYIKKYSKGNICDEYIFEVFFQLGIEKQQLKICQPQYKDVQKQCFDNAGEKIPYNKKIADLLEKIENPKELSQKINQVNHHYFKKVTQYLIDNGVFEKERHLNPTDLKLTHEAYFFRCPNSYCRKLIENLVENWVLVKTESDNEYRLVCIECKGGRNGN